MHHHDGQGHQPKALKWAYKLFLTRREDFAEVAVGVYPTHCEAVTASRMFLDNDLFRGRYLRALIKKVGR